MRSPAPHPTGQPLLYLAAVGCEAAGWRGDRISPDRQRRPHQSRLHSDRATSSPLAAGWRWGDGGVRVRRRWRCDRQHLTKAASIPTAAARRLHLSILTQPPPQLHPVTSVTPASGHFPQKLIRSRKKILRAMFFLIKVEKSGCNLCNRALGKGFSDVTVGVTADQGSRYVTAYGARV